MFGFLKKRMVVAEVDGIKFYTYKAFAKYIAGRDEREAKRQTRVGKHCYTFDIPYHQAWTSVPDAKCVLERAGCFDYEVYSNGEFVTVKYWAKNFILGWKGV